MRQPDWQFDDRGTPNPREVAWAKDGDDLRGMGIVLRAFDAADLTPEGEK